MPETFKIERVDQFSSDSILDVEDQRRAGLLDYGRRRSRLGSRFSRPPRQSISNFRIRSSTVVDIETNKFMDVLLFCSAMVLWTSGGVMLAFGFYLVLSQYGWAVITGSTMYWVGMILQTASALTVLFAAAIVTTLLTPDKDSPKRVMLGFICVIISALLLISEIVVCSFSKANQKRKADDFYSMIMLTVENKTFNEQQLKRARKEGFECKEWDKNHCKKIYRRYIEMFINFLIGSACITLGIIILVVPVLYFVYQTTVHKISRARTPDISVISSAEGE